MLDVVIIGSGPAGITAAIYAKRANLNVAVVEKEYLGTGQIAESSRVDNYPGIPGIDGYSLGEKVREHAESLGVEFTEAQVLSLGQKDGIWIIGCDEDITLEIAVEMAKNLVEKGMSINNAAKETAAQTPFKKGDIYKALI